MDIPAIIVALGGIAAAVLGVIKLFDEIFSRTEKGKEKAKKKKEEEHKHFTELAVEFIQPYVESFEKAIQNLRAEYKEQDDELRKQLNDSRNVEVLVLRQMMLEIYYRHCNTDKKLHEHEKQLLAELYEIYHEQYHKNGYIEHIYNEMMEWE